jgi:hypothetical protein
MLPNLRGFVIFPEDSNLPTLSLFTSNSSNYSQMFIPFFFIFHLAKLIFLLLLKKLVGTSILKIRIEIVSWEKKRPNHPSPLLKRRRREVKVGPKFGGQWNGRRKKHLFTSSHFPPNNFIETFKVELCKKELQNAMDGDSGLV